ncbi:MAG: hypothetical protein NUW00_05015 [Candidatus Kaiserbacteria bacterium]|nr:hypothetical protein [Candidatus Kaiserbacteria bacterium]
MENNSKKGKYKIRDLFIGLSVFFIFFALASSSSNTPSPSPSPQTKSVYVPDEMDLHIQAQQFLLQALKAPSTAKFPPLPYEAVKINTPEGAEDSDGVYRVRSYVDSQNSFGAMTRNEWTVEMMLVKEHWIPTRMVIAGKVVYDALSDN